MGQRRGTPMSKRRKERVMRRDGEGDTRGRSEGGMDGEGGTEGGSQWKFGGQHPPGAK